MGNLMGDLNNTNKHDPRSRTSTTNNFIQFNPNDVSKVIKDFLINWKIIFKLTFKCFICIVLSIAGKKRIIRFYKQIQSWKLHSLYYALFLRFDERPWALWRMRMYKAT